MGKSVSATVDSLSSFFNLRSKPMVFIIGYMGPKYQCYSFTFLPKMPHFHHFSMLKSIDFNSDHFWEEYQGYSFTFWSTLAHFHHLSICTQNQSLSTWVIFR